MEGTFKDILNSNKDAIYRICKAYATDEEHIKDLFQEVLLNIWRSLSGFKGHSAINTWVYRITLNVCMRAKYNADRHKVVVKLDSLQWMPQLQAEETKDRNYIELYTCIATLNETDKSLILLFLEELPYKEIAVVTGLTENNIAVKIKRIKDKLFTCLKAKGYDR